MEIRDDIRRNLPTFPTGKVYSRYDPEILELVRRREEESRTARPDILEMVNAAVERHRELLQRLSGFAGDIGQDTE